MNRFIFLSIYAACLVMWSIYPLISLLALKQSANFFLVAIVIFMLNSFVYLGISLNAKSFNDTTLSMVAIVIGCFIAYYYYTEVRAVVPKVRVGLFKEITVHQDWFNHNWQKNENDFKKNLNQEMKSDNFGEGWLYKRGDKRPSNPEMMNMMLEKRASEFRKTRGMDQKIDDLQQLRKLRSQKSKLTSQEIKKQIQSRRSKNPTFLQQFCTSNKTCGDLAKGSVKQDELNQMLGFLAPDQEKQHETFKKELLATVKSAKKNLTFDRDTLTKQLLSSKDPWVDWVKKESHRSKVSPEDLLRQHIQQAQSLQRKERRSTARSIGKARRIKTSRR